jgi:hypothetical protein
MEPGPGRKDVFFVYAAIVDENGTLVPSAEIPISFALTGPGGILGPHFITSEAGISSLLVQTLGEKGIIKISAHAQGFKNAARAISIE